MNIGDDNMDDSSSGFMLSDEQILTEGLDGLSETGSFGYFDDDTDLALAFENMDLDGLSRESKAYTNNKTEDMYADKESEIESSDEALSEFEVDDEEEDFSYIFSDKGNLKLLHDAIKQVQLPTWIGRVPNGIGSAAGGKLKAAEWVILFQTMIIPALILIAHDRGTNLSDVLAPKAVHNTLHLISVLNIIRQLEVSDDDVKSLTYHLKRYRQGLSHLFGSFPILPNHHMSLHIPRVLKMFGPAPQWSAWSFERLNGALTQILNNNHPDERELTLLKKWNTAQNMRSILPVLCKGLPTKASNLLLKLSMPKRTWGSVSQGLQPQGEVSSNYAYAPQKSEGLSYESHERLVSRMNEISEERVLIAMNAYKVKNKTANILPLS
ncbi:uncharacterized protein MELLADRAFT_104452 [Melampsora larici-populina 98AG31]|uniref:Uncharacterized protein n=1 Tax=Melampsora larici-populina (strain 98AG31 / pathotype 3-4-7) TaxID=747676 RepID=F4RER1_MELLP|nr:uncharacterized protein MELLADRAFT_104452 [Melampsora larici-populina 98AG31]EGG09143.1 hypothetical protein MELLADRAFT_104452 [Melampsora larici-populina 98AG31]